MNILKKASYGTFCVMIIIAFKANGFKPSIKGIAFVNDKTDARASVAQVNITPPIGTPLAGYTEERLSTAVHDSLWAKAIVLHQKKG